MRFVRLSLAVLPALLAAVSARAVPYGVNAHVPSPELLDLARDAGIAWVRIDFVWEWVEPEQDRFDWHIYDAVANAAATRGLQVYATLIHTPAWATDGPPGTGAPRDALDWYDVCYRAAERYRGRIDHWGMWNEPNSTRFWAGTRSGYIETILRTGSRAIHAANPEAKVCGPGLGHLQSGDWDDWLWEVIKNASDSLDVVTHHLYPSDGATSVIDKLVNGGDYPWDPPSVEEVLKKTGWLGRPFWLTETGFDSASASTGQDEQATFVTRLFNSIYGRYSSVDWVHRVFIYELVDDPRFDKRWGIVGADLVPKPAYAAYRDRVDRLPVDDTEVVNALIPERLAPGASTTATITFRNTGTTTWSAADGYLLVARGGVDPFADPLQPLPADRTVAPGEDVEFSLLLTAGQSTTPENGVISEWAMSRDGTLFGEPVRRSVRVTHEGAPWRWYVPAAANSPGVNGTHWATDLVLHNPAQDTLQVVVAALEQDRGNERPRAATIEVGPRSSVRLVDVVGRLFGLLGTVALRIDAERPWLRVSSRTYDRLEAGTRGEYVPAVPDASGPSTDDVQRLIGLRRATDLTTGVRTNLGLVNPAGEPIVVEVELLRDGGRSLGTLAIELPPWGYRQITDVFASVTDGPVDGGVAVIRATGRSRPIAYAASVDNRSGDPSVVIAGPQAADELIVPAAAHAIGVGGSQWRTDLILHNPGATPASVSIELLRGGSSPTVTRILLPDATEHLEDVVASSFDSAGVAPIRLTIAGGGAAAVSRTYNLTSAGAFGQLIPVVPETAAAGVGDVVRLLQLSRSTDPSTGYRTNLGFVNLGPDPISLKVQLYRSPSQQLGTTYVTVPARGGAQLNDAFTRFTSLGVEDGWAIVSVDSPGARFFAWASLVDNVTGDPSFALGLRD